MGIDCKHDKRLYLKRELVQSTTGVPMVATADFVVQSPDQQNQLIVETKTKVAASPDWVARLRRNLLADPRWPAARFFLLALPDRFYLWKNGTSQADVPPDFEVDAREVLRPYVGKLTTDLSALNRYSFELVVRSWLDDLVNSNREPADLPESERWVVDSGLYDAVNRGYIRTRTTP
jgi:hypothetical protein